jgi:Na+/H+ antiporter NhaB
MRSTTGVRHQPREESALDSDHQVEQLHRDDLDQFRAFLRSLLMHGAVGTALGGVCTLVGEPQNLLIGHEMGWHFADFFFKVAPVSMPAGRRPGHLRAAGEAAPVRLRHADA